jgi:hypothetical protein
MKNPTARDIVQGELDAVKTRFAKIKDSDQTLEIARVSSQVLCLAHIIDIFEQYKIQ